MQHWDIRTVRKYPIRSFLKGVIGLCVQMLKYSYVVICTPLKFSGTYADKLIATREQLVFNIYACTAQP